MCASVLQGVKSSMMDCQKNAGTIYNDELRHILAYDLSSPTFAFKYFDPFHKLCWHRNRKYLPWF